MIYITFFGYNIIHRSMYSFFAYTLYLTKKTYQQEEKVRSRYVYIYFVNIRMEMCVLTRFAIPSLNISHLKKNSTRKYFVLEFVQQC